MAGEVQLKLQTSLDLAFLRSQLASLGSLAKGYNLPIVAKLDTKQVDAAVKKVSKEIRININDSQLDGLTKRLGSVKQQLESLKAQDNKIEIGVTGRAALSEREARKVKSDLRAAILSSEKKLYIPTSIKPVISRTDIRSFKNEVRNKIGTITIDVRANLQAQAVKGGAKTQAEIDADVARGLQAISAMGEARMQGGSAGAGVTEAARRAQLRTAIEDLTVAQLRQVAKQMEIGGASKLRKGDLINKIVADASIEMVRRYLDPQAMMRPNRAGLQQVLDTFARGVFHMLGLDPASMRRQAAERRALPPINWPAQVPQRQIEIGPSSTGRALPQGVVPGMLPGTSYTTQKRLIGDILSPSLKEALRGAANAFVDNVRRELNSAVRQVSVRDLGVAIRGALPPGAAPPSVPMLPAAGGSGGYFGGGRRPGGGFVPPGGFPSDGIQGPRSPMGGPRTDLSAGYLSGMQFAKSLRESDRYLRQARVPLAGAIEELGGEFAEATKQVLLYGTAYKGLAFFMDLPRQTLDAATALQTFKNQLLAVTGSAESANQTFGFVDGLSQRFAVPLDSAREGFVRLYASMQPAGFSAGEIEGLFEGISKAAATFGMSKDKVDRVTYAFSQMASKGQIMAEELRGQLGDVLPGSLALFAQAAQMSIPEFTKAMENGAFSGKAMQQVLGNVAVLLNTKFASGAQGAAQTLQGSLNTMQNELIKLYEAFEPLVNQIARQVFPIVSSSIADATSAIKAFAAAMQGNQGPANMLNSNARAIYEAMRQLTEIAKATWTILQQLAPSFIALGRGLLFVVEQIARFVNTSFGSFLANVALQAALVTAALQAFARIGLFAAIRGLILFVVQMDAAIAKLRLLITTSAAARFALIGLGAAVVITAIQSVAAAFEQAANRAELLRRKTVEATQSIRQMNETEVVAEKQRVSRDIGFLQSLGGKTNLTPEEANRARALGVDIKTQETGAVIPGTRGQRAVVRSVADRNQLQLMLGRQQDLMKEVEYRERVLDTSQAPPALQPIDQAGGTKAGTKVKAESLESYYSLQNQLAKNATDFAASQTEEEFRHKVELLELYYDIQESRANAYQKDALRFEREMMMIDAKRQEARLKAELEVQRAQAGVGGGVPSGSIGTTTTGGTSIGSFTSQQLAKATQDASRFTGVANMCSEAVKSFYKSLGFSLPGVTAWADTVRNAGQVMRDWSQLKPGDIVATGRPGDTPHVGVYTGGQNVFHQSRSRGLRTGNFPDLGYFQRGGYFVRPTRAQSMGGVAPGKVPASERRDEIAQQKTLQAVIAKTETRRMADAKAAQEQIAAFEKYKAVALPTVEQELQNKLLAKRNELFRSGLSEDQIGTEIKLYENQERGAAILEVIARLQNEKIISDEKAAQWIGELNDLIARQNNLLGQNATLVRQSKFDQAIKNIRDQIAMARAITPDQELRTDIAQQGFTGAEAELMFQERKMLESAQRIKEQQSTIASSIGDAFGNAFKGIISGTASVRDALAGMFQSIADSFADMVAKMIAEWLRAQVIKGFMSILSAFTGGLGGGFAGAFGAGGPTFNPGAFAGPALSAGSAFGAAGAPILGAGGSASTGLAFSGVKLFADGGMVTGPTLGLIGEGRFNEAVVPLPNGKSIPVDLGDGAGNQIMTNITVNVSNGQMQNSGGNSPSELARKLDGAVKQVLINELRPGGVLASGRR
jgi:tape measure domain-containing protein